MSHASSIQSRLTWRRLRHVALLAAASGVSPGVPPASHASVGTGYHDVRNVERPLRMLEWYRVDPEGSQLYGVMHRSGPLWFLGHEHAIVPIRWSAELCLAAPIPRGAYGTVLIETGSLQFDSDYSRWLAGMDGGTSLHDRREISAKMKDSSHLAADDFPQIRFHLRADRTEQDHRLTANGALTLRAVIRYVDVPVSVERTDGGAVSLQGTLRIRLRDFGIRPESHFGLVKMSNDVDLHFVLAAKPTGEACQAEQVY